MYTAHSEQDALLFFSCALVYRCEARRTTDCISASASSIISGTRWWQTYFLPGDHAQLRHKLSAKVRLPVAHSSKQAVPRTVQERLFCAAGKWQSSGGAARTAQERLLCGAGK